VERFLVISHLEPNVSRKITWTALAVAILSGHFTALAETPDVGQKAPVFSLSTPDGHSLSLSEFTEKGTVVLIVLRGYPGYQCPYCMRQVHDFVENADKFVASKATVLLVYPGPPADLDQRAKEFLAKQNPLPENIHLVTDPDYKFTNQYGLRWDAPRETAYPSTFLIDRHGVIFFRKISNGHGDRTTAEDILAELLLAGNMFVAYWTADHEALTSLFSDPGKFYVADPYTFLFASLMILIFGAGLFSLDEVLTRKLKNKIERSELPIFGAGGDNRLRSRQ